MCDLLLTNGANLSGAEENRSSDLAGASRRKPAPLIGAAVDPSYIALTMSSPNSHEHRPLPQNTHGARKPKYGQTHMDTLR
ncbi:hypothetical protein FKM82_021058 [Ascaphus truei]